MRWIDGLALLAIAGLAACLVVQPSLRALEGPAYDLLLRARHLLYDDSSRRNPTAPPSPVVVIALDQDTALRPPFDRLPQELWTPQIAVVMRQVLHAGARLVAQQQAFVTTAEGAVEGYDADYVAVLAEAAAKGRIVLGRRAPAPDRLGPAPAHAEAAGGDRNVRHIALYSDTDGVLRHAALYESSRDRTGAVSVKPTLALEIAARVIGERPHLLQGTDLLLGRHPVPGSEDNAMLLNFRGGDGGVPVFSLGDLYACAEDGEAGFFRKHFHDKVVIFGRTEGPRWRRVTAARFLGVSMADRYAERCRLPLMQALTSGDGAGESAATMPEVLVSATAVRNLLLREGVKTLPTPAAFAIAAVLAVAAAAALLRFAAHHVALAALAAFVGWSYLAVVLLAREAWLIPLAQPVIAAGVAFAAGWTYRALRRR